MNSQGYTKDNIHKGNTKIVAGGIDVDGLVRIGDQSVGGDGYVLPAVKGTEGQVLTMNADNTTSFQDNASGSMTRVGAGDNNTVSIPATTLGVPLVPSFQGVKIVDIKNIPPGSSYIIEAVSAVEFTYDGTSPTIQSYLGVNLNLSLGGTSSNTITVNNQSNPNVYPSPVVVGTIYRANWYYKAVITRNFNGTAFYISTFSTMNRFGNPNYYVNMPTIPTGAIFFTIDGDPDDTTIDFDLTIDQALGAGTIVRYEGPSINWYVSQIDEVNPPTLLTNDHTLLSNLNSGDAGHTQFALLSGRNGGQILSGGLTPLHFLTLKSHNAGLNNIVVKDLNTTFEKDIDMNSNEIKNVVSVTNNNPLALGDLVKGNTIILDRDISNGVYLEANPAQDITLNAGGGTNFFKVRASDVLMGSNLDMNSNDINNANVISSSGVLNIKQNTPANDIKLSVDTEELVIKQSVYGGVKLIEADPLKQIQIGTDDGIGNDSNLRTLSTSTQFDKNIEMNANINDNSGGTNIIGNGVLFWGDVRSTKLTGDGIYEKSGGSQSLELNAGDVKSLKTLDMNTNDITNANVIVRASNGNVIDMDNDILPPFVTGALTIDAGAGKQARLSAGAILELQGNIIDHNSGTGNHQFSNVAGGNLINFTGTEIDVRKPINMNNGDINVVNNLNVVSINNLTPVGGLSSGTSNGALLTASTAEQSILALTFVGGRQAPANTFKVGDAYTATLAGEFSSNNGDTLTLRLKGGATGTTILSSLVVPLNGSSGVYYELEINFVVRAIGGAGVADLVINYDFSYNQSAGGNFQGERKCEVNNTTFDTTILNSLDITAQFSSTNAGNSIETLLSTLGKNY